MKDINVAGTIFFITHAGFLFLQTFIIPLVTTFIYSVSFFYFLFNKYRLLHLLKTYYSYKIFLDCFSANELITYDALGLCEEGKLCSIDRMKSIYLKTT